LVPLYLARIEDLGPGDFVKIDCAACSHTALLSTAFLSRLGLDPRDKVLDLKNRVKCAMREVEQLCRSSGENQSPHTLGICEQGTRLASRADRGERYE